MATSRARARTTDMVVAEEAAAELQLTRALPNVDTVELPFETGELRKQLKSFMAEQWGEPQEGRRLPRIGSYRGVYAFYDYDEEPIYVGQTVASLGDRISRHLTNQRTDAVAMSVLDPYEVCYIEVWPVPQYSHRKLSKEEKPAVIAYFNALEYEVYQTLLSQSSFGAVLNEKLPLTPIERITLPPSFKAKVVSNEVSRLRDHPDLRMARRASTLARLAKVISEREVTTGLRTVLLNQARRMVKLAEMRLGGAPLVIDAGSDEEPGEV